MLIQLRRGCCNLLVKHRVNYAPKSSAATLRGGLASPPGDLGLHCDTLFTHDAYSVSRGQLRLSRKRCFIPAGCVSQNLLCLQHSCLCPFFLRELRTSFRSFMSWYGDRSFRQFPKGHISDSISSVSFNLISVHDTCWISIMIIVLSLYKTVLLCIYWPTSFVVS